jgi:hypothetical protein
MSATRFVIKIRSAEYSWLDTRMQNAFGGTSSIPTLRVAPNCVCCSAPTSRKLAIDVAAYRGRVNKPCDLPVCDGCADHLVLRIRSVAELVLAVGAAGFALGVVVGVLAALPWLALGCVAPCVILTVLYHRHINARCSALLATGHAAGLKLTAEPHTLIVSTTSRQLARSLLDLNPTAVLDHPHERFLADPPVVSKPARLPRATARAATPSPPASRLVDGEPRNDSAPRFLD